MSSNAPLLLAEHITAGYGRMDILHDVGLAVRPGEIVSVIGPNGAGKSTTFKTIVGFLRPRAGRVVFNGEDITGLRTDLVLRRGLAYVPQGRIVFPQMTVRENLEMGGFIERSPARLAAALERVFTLFLGLSPKFVTLIFDKLVEMKTTGYTLMLVEQNATRALAIADRAYVLELGRNRFEGPGPQLLTDPEVKRLYLGG